MSTDTLLFLRPCEPSHVTRDLDKTQYLTLASFAGFPIVAYSNSTAQGFALGVLASDNGLGLQSRYAVVGFKRKPSRKALVAAIEQVRDYIVLNTADTVPDKNRLRPYTAPAPVTLTHPEDGDLLGYLKRESQPIGWSVLCLNSLRRSERFCALTGSLERLEAAGAVKTWDHERDGTLIAITGAGRLNIVYTDTSSFTSAAIA